MWSYVYTESFFDAFAAMYNVAVENMELLSDRGSEYTLGIKLHFQIRLKAEDAAKYAKQDESSAKAAAAAASKKGAPPPPPRPRTPTQVRFLFCVARCVCVSLCSRRRCCMTGQSTSWWAFARRLSHTR